MKLRVKKSFCAGSCKTGIMWGVVGEFVDCIKENKNTYTVKKGEIAKNINKNFFDTKGI